MITAGSANPLLITPEGYQISRSVRLRSSASAYFNRTPAAAGNLQKYTWSGWVKRGTLPSSGNIGLFTVGATDAASDGLIFNGAGVLFLFFANATYSLTTNAIYRDPSAWYHIVFSVDTTQATAANRVSLYVNGVQVTSFSASSYPTQNYNCYFNSAAIHAIGRQQQTSPANYFDGYLTEVNFIDGQALTPSSFGETNPVTGVWQPKKYAGTYGTNGFYLNFSDPSAATAAAIGKDYSGNGNNWTPNNISVTAGVTYDSMLDVPTMWADGGNGRGNYAVMNPLQKGANIAISNGNLTSVKTAATSDDILASTIFAASGKFYCEATISAISANVIFGITSGGVFANAFGNLFYPAYGYRNDGAKIQSSSSDSQATTTAYGASFTTGDVIGIAFDASAGSVTFYKNGVSQGAAFTGLTLTQYGVYAAATNNSSSNTINWNYGQRPFTYTPPTGFLALNTQNLPDATIKKGNQYFDALTWSGDNASTRNITGNFAPDFVWTKSRSGAYWHNLFDTSRGASNALATNNTNAEYTASTSGYLSAFLSNGFTLSAGSVDSLNTNATGQTYVGWQWKESVTAGFDIVTYTGTGAARTIAHSLNAAPKMYIVKQRSGVSNWETYHTSLGSDYYVVLDGTNAKINSTVVWNNTAPTSTVFSLGTGGNNTSGQTYVAYLFAEVAGFSKFGSYTGNGSADGPFVFLGFRPRFLMVKRSDSASDWYMVDTSRDTYNLANKSLFADLSDAESTIYATFDILSNGFKLRGSTTNNMNGSGGTYIYAAFAESPFRNSLAR